MLGRLIVSGGLWASIVDKNKEETKDKKQKLGIRVKLPWVRAKSLGPNLMLKT